MDDDSIAWEEKRSRTVALKQLRLFSISWGPWKKSGISADCWSVTIREGRAHPQEADKGRNGPGAEGLVDSQCRGFNTGRSTVVLGQGTVREV